MISVTLHSIESNKVLKIEDISEEDALLITISYDHVHESIIVNREDIIRTLIALGEKEVE